MCLQWIIKFYFCNIFTEDKISFKLKKFQSKFPRPSSYSSHLAELKYCSHCCMLMCYRPKYAWNIIHWTFYQQQSIYHSKNILSTLNFSQHSIANQGFVNIQFIFNGLLFDKGKHVFFVFRRSSNITKFWYLLFLSWSMQKYFTADDLFLKVCIIYIMHLIKIYGNINKR